MPFSTSTTIVILSALIFLLVSTITLPLLSQKKTTAVVGATYSAKTFATYFVPPALPSTAKSLCLTSLCLDFSDPILVESFQNSGVSLMLTVPNHLAPLLVGNHSAASLWLKINEVPLFFRSEISIISVGNQFLEDSAKFAEALVPAMRNVQGSFLEIGIANISVSTSVAFMQLVTIAFPPSQTKFNRPGLHTVSSTTSALDTISQ